MAGCTKCGLELAPGAKFCSECGTPAAQERSREQRKTVTAVFCDLTGSTALGESTDPEALRALLARYFEQMKVIVERHGGSVEKFIGDAVMAVFGVPVVHEDDALRACRAALEMRDALPELGLRGRIGVNTGEVVAGTAERLATGDAVNVAARLEQAAAPGEVLIGSATRKLLRSVVEVGEQRLLELKGKSGRVPAYPLLATVGDEISARRQDAPIVGRERERRVLGEVWERALSEKACQLFTLLGAAGVGKSRLATEFLESGADVKMLYGRCLSYGEGISYTPVVEMLTQLGQRPSDPRAASALASLMGESDAVVSGDEIAWGFRKLLEEVAPVVCVFDDIHWAEQSLLDLVDHVADWSRDAPILLMCLARPELLDRRPSWAGGKLNATTLLLEVLTAAETDQLIDQLLGSADLDAGLRGRIGVAAQGNPLFVEEMLAMAADSGGADITVPPTIQALLSARLDQLDHSERSVLEHGSVEGQVFHMGGLSALAPGESDLPGRLMKLVRKELVRPERSEVQGDDAFRFRHLLIRDAAYDGLPKATRAELHGRFARWLETSVADLAELDEVAGYHLEQAHRYRRELGYDDEITQELATRASSHLLLAGDRAVLRADVNAATSLLTRALALGPRRPIDITHELRLVGALMGAGALSEATARCEALIQRAVELKDQRTEALARIRWRFAAVQTEGASWADLDAESRAVIEMFEATHDDEGLAHAWSGVAIANVGALRWSVVQESAQRSGEYAALCGDAALQLDALYAGATGRTLGPSPAADVLAWSEENAEQLDRLSSVHSSIATIDAMVGDFDGARRRYQRSWQNAIELGQRLHAAGSAMWLVYIELLAGDYAAGARAGVRGCAELEELNELAYMSTVAGMTAEAFYRSGDQENAREYADRADRAGSPDDLITQSLIRRVRAKLHADAGAFDQAERLAREALSLIEPGDMIDQTAEAQLVLADVLFSAGRGSEALVVLDAADELFARKGNVVRVGHVAGRRAKMIAATIS